MMTVSEVCRKAKENVRAIALASENDMNTMLSAAARALRDNAKSIIEENKKDIAACTRGAQFVDRLMLDEKRIDGIAVGLEKLIELPSPVGEILEERTLYNGLLLRRVRVPIGVLGIIYEARPNVTADAIGLSIKSGNAVVLRGSKDAILSNRAVTSVIKSAIRSAGYDPEFIQLIEDTSREGATEFMKMNGVVDVLIPRGSAGLIQNAVQNATVPIIETGTGNCHVYFEDTADIDKALPILINAKTQRTSVCNACESLLIDEAFAQRHLREIVQSLRDKNVEIVACEKCRAIMPELAPASEEDFYTEFLALKISIKIVHGVDEAIAHINKYGTHHSDSIVTNDAAAAEKFLNEVDSAAVYVNASTRFTDGFEFGLGAEMGISTQKLHARGPMGLRELTSYKYQVTGNGQIRG
ncbi:MAG TPA: glutamate-5-semialdehyde dehydrogenase [Candidatus Borkfalkia excrementigallinarum]|uniref:Gamma-glutamyl phosphate reductase n=1 Tax=Candidatus Borkfalkia excrementigallinarum TaxID=2838506 RepID=A0A9D2CSJ8_9FIRM|nr:glutamate-5-semialdehyde dehydrogenase [Candidatus Borkfalkia excrementigallinarum]